MRRLRSILGIATTLGLLTAGGLIAQSAQAADGDIHGTVATVNGPVSSGTVYLYATCQDYNSEIPENLWAGSGSISGGSYAVADVPSGTYRVLIVPDGGAKSWHGAKPSCEQADAVTVSGNTSVNLIGGTGVTVSGTVTSSNGPMTGGYVHLYATCEDYNKDSNSSFGYDSSIKYLAGFAEIGPDGTYATNVNPGMYRVRIDPAEGTGAVPSWHNAKATCEQAGTVAVTGDTTANLVATAGFAVSGTVSSSHGPFDSGSVAFYATCQNYNDGDSAGSGDISGGTYSIEVPAGTYRVQISKYMGFDPSWHSAKSSCAQADTVTVTDDATLNLVALSTTRFTVSGTVSSTNGAVNSGQVMFYPTCEDYDNGVTPYPGLGSDYIDRGTYSTSLPDGTYRVLCLTRRRCRQVMERRQAQL